LYYRLNVTSIYEFLEKRLGFWSYKTGAGFFILSRTLGSAIRLYLATNVLQLFLFNDLGVPYWATAITTVALIWVYTFKGGIKTIVYTDTFQTFFLVSAVILCTFVVANSLGFNFTELYDSISAKTTTSGWSMTKILYFDDYRSNLFFPKHFFGGMFLAIAMTGLDQDLMQKNLTCKSIGEAQKNMYSFTAILVVVNFLFLLLGGALYVFADSKGIQLPVNEVGAIKTDDVFPTLALNNFGTLAGVFFLLGITASSYASADSALAALTTGFCIDFLNFNQREEKAKQRIKLQVHIGFSVLFLVIILLTKAFVTGDLINVVLTVASYTYGPLLGLFFFGILTKRTVRDRLSPLICIAVPFLCYYISLHSKSWFNGYVFGYEMLILNGFLTFIGLYLLSKPAQLQISLEK
jgi:Na+/proline symporter